MKNIEAWSDLLEFQIDTAEIWLKRGREVKDRFSKFLFFFAGLNALYFLWGKVDNVKKSTGDPAGEQLQLDNLIRKFDNDGAQKILEALSDSIIYFQKRAPIQRIDKRTIESQNEGDDSEGKRYRSKLTNDHCARDRLIVLARILYLVRSNLVHGSKKGHENPEDDLEIIKFSIGALEVILREAIILTKRSVT
jgi:hypothetical protein